jgi:hypothetical protein
MLPPEREEQAINEAARLLEEYFSAPKGSAVVEEQPPYSRVDALIRVGELVFVVEYKSHSFAGRIHQAVQQLQHAGQRDWHPLLVVPYMGNVGRSICEEANVNWLDLSGNTRIIIGRQIRIIIEGKRNKFLRQGRPKDLFSPAASRIVRWLLMNPEARPLQTEVADAAEASESYVSKVVNRLIREGELSRDKDGRLRLVDPSALFNSWHESYDIHRHNVIRGYAFARSGPELMHQLSGKLAAAGARHAMTGLAGAWLYDKFASFRTVSLYLSKAPSDELLSKIGFRQGDKAANVWLILPNDMGVFDGERVLEDMPVVHELQVFLDLKSHAERAEEAAEHLRANHLNWSRHG